MTDEFDTTDTPDLYVVAHAMAALAADPRVGVLDLTVSVAAGTIRVTGPIETEERRQAVGAVLAERFPTHRIDNAVHVRTGRPSGDDPEELS
jgi:hypothetical protein